MSPGWGVTLPALQFDPSSSERVWLLLSGSSSTDLASPFSHPKQDRMFLVGLGFFSCTGVVGERGKGTSCGGRTLPSHQWLLFLCSSTWLGISTTGHSPSDPLCKDIFFFPNFLGGRKSLEKASLPPTSGSHCLPLLLCIPLLCVCACVCAPEGAGGLILPSRLCCRC